MNIKILFIGDIVGSNGRRAIQEVLPYLKQKYHPDFIIANGENAAAGRGITEKIANELFAQGVHGITMGNHTWAQKEIFDFIDRESRLIRPANFPPGTPGKGHTVITANSKQLLIINVQGRTYLPSLDCPFRTIDRLLEQFADQRQPILVDFHAEATSEKIAYGWYLDGKVSAVIGTHTHVQTNDEKILPQGTAFVTDVGMVGPIEGVLGMEREAVLRMFQTQLPVRFHVAEGKWQFHAVTITLDDNTYMAKDIQLIRLSEDRFYMDN